MASSVIFKLRTELNNMIESHLDLNDGELSEQSFASEILAIEKKLEALYQNTVK